MIWITPFAAFSFVADTVFMLLMLRKSGAQRPGTFRRALSLVCFLLIGVLYLSSQLWYLSGSLWRFVVRFILTALGVLLGYRMKVTAALYISLLLTELCNLVHGQFLTSMTSVVQSSLGELCESGELWLMLLLCILRAALLFVVYKAVSTDRIRSAKASRVLPLLAVTALGLYTRGIQFSMLTGSADAQAREMNIYFFALQLSLLLAIVMYENYQNRLQDSWALERQKLMTASLIDTLELRNASDEKVSRMRHDLKNHLLTIRAMIENGEADRALDYIDEFVSRGGAPALRIRTGRPLLDALMSEKLGAAVNQGIAVSVVANFSDSGFVDDFDMCMLMGNALDNALEACSAMAPEEERFIEVKGGVSANILAIRIVNSCRPDSLREELRTTKRDSAAHGYGLKIIRSTLRSHGGSMHIQTTPPGRFTLVMNLPIPEETKAGE